MTYVARYATTQAKLRRYLDRKIAEGDWQGETAPAPDQIVARCAELGFVDDRAYAESKAGSLVRRGFGSRRVKQALQADGIDREEINSIVSNDLEAELEAALIFAKRRRFGPFSQSSPAPDIRRRQLAAMARAGHGFAVACKILDLDVDSVQDR